MTVKFYAYIRDAEFADCKQTQWPAVPDLRTLGEQMSQHFGPKFRNEFFSPDGKALGERIIIMINGRRAEFLGNLDAPLCDTDTVLVFPVVAGG